MATVTKENIGLLNEKLTLKLEKTDYLPTFEKSLKDYSKKANIPGFRKGMVPAGLIKKMYGASLFTDEVLRTIDRELIKYLEEEKLDIFAQPLPVEMDIRQLDMNNPVDYTFHFEIGMKPKFELADLSTANTIRYKVKITDEMINNEITRLQNRYGNMKDENTVNTEENVLNVIFTEVDENGNEIEGGIKKDNSLLVKYFKEEFRNHLMGKTINDYLIAQLDNAFAEKELDFILNDLGIDKNDSTASQKHFKIQITKVGLLEKKELNEEFYKQLYPPKESLGTNAEVTTENDFRNKIKEEIQVYWDNQAKNQLQHMAYHELLDGTTIDFPESFLKKWMQTQGEEKKTEEDAEKEFPTFKNQLKWTLISDKIVRENNIDVKPEEVKAFARQQLFGYMNMPTGGDDQPWVDNYIDKMMQDRKYVEDAYNRIQGQKVFEWAETQVKPTEKEIAMEDFVKMQEEHQHHHH